LLSGNIGDCVRPECDQSVRRMWVALYVEAGPDHGPYYVVQFILLFQSVILVSGIALEFDVRIVEVPWESKFGI
jgi:hypothetical protein